MAVAESAGIWESGHPDPRLPSPAQPKPPGEERWDVPSPVQAFFACYSEEVVRISLV